jgi:hypothetical protein
MRGYKLIILLSLISITSLGICQNVDTVFCGKRVSEQSTYAKNIFLLFYFSQQDTVINGTCYKKLYFYSDKFLNGFYRYYDNKLFYLPANRFETIIIPEEEVFNYSADSSIIIVDFDQQVGASWNVKDFGPFLYNSFMIEDIQYNQDDTIIIINTQALDYGHKEYGYGHYGIYFIKLYFSKQRGIIESVADNKYIEETWIFEPVPYKKGDCKKYDTYIGECHPIHKIKMKKKKILV